MQWYFQEGGHSDISMKDYTKYTSPFSWRYGSEEMRSIFSEENKYKLWRKIWVELARAQHKFGLISPEELKDLENNQENLSIERIWEIEKETKHDVVAAIKEFAEKAKIGGGKIHLGATSMDVSDNAETIRLSEALILIEKELINLLREFGKKIKQYSGFVCMGYTHLQPAEPTTLGYRFAFYAQDLLMDLELLQFVKKNLKAKGFKGAVGTSASYVKLMGEKAERMELEILDGLGGLEPYEVTNQTSPRKIELWVANLLSSIAESLNKFAFDLRIMQSPAFGEWQEPFGTKQVGSSAMPFKKNPVTSEKICSLARLVVSLSRTSWDNASLTLLERTLDDSANRRVAIPEMFLATDEILHTATNIVEGLVINEKKIFENLNTFWPYAASEILIIEAVKKGADRQKIHESLIGKQVNKEDLKKLPDAKNHVGNASQKALDLVSRIKKI
ncbi:MAG: adenylosuccinate lyase [Microgenomates group bacterium Gr01-1014_7]|nr:MAG: adenylosuccinate lyase [Microgenomates group bacterium Gr01-1014_7]